ncbi:biopolymer transporter ExbD [Limnohabitans sp. Rim8]|uniref:ExbD/TolR family protein n=1 Tax=Limnohabitans sp. Rim8 TaxID=1100718 RepID=UPI002615D4BD|nr:biopolymer transporter ExbD [Limnohabitans sp. Rim8]
MAMHLGTDNSDEDGLMMDINTTPLIDVMLVLIIMLIITIPAQLHAVNLDMPTASPASPKEPVVVRIDINAQSQWSWNGKALGNREELEAQLILAAAQRPQPELHIRADGQARYEAAVTVLTTAQRVGLTQLGMVGTEQFAN